MVLPSPKGGGFLFTFVAMTKKEYKVLTFITVRDEGMKPYKVGSTISLEEDKAQPLIDANLIEPIPAKNESKGTKKVLAKK